MRSDFGFFRSPLRGARFSSFLGLLLASAFAPAAGCLSPAIASEVAHRATGDWDEGSRTELLAALDDRARHGLERVSFLDSENGGSPSASHQMLGNAALRYARALAHGLVDPSSLHDPFTLARADRALESGLQTALASGKLGEWLKALPPQDEAYARLSRAYLEFRAQPSTGEKFDIEGKLLRVGTTDPRIPEIVEQLIADEYLAAGQEVSQDRSNGRAANVYTELIAEAIKRLQRDYGIAADGVIGPDTMGVLNLGPGERARAIAVALERRRWLDRSPPATRIDVNTAAARLDYYRDGALVDSRRVVVGKSGTETPPLQSPIYRLVANPTWTVPKSIQNGELANVGEDYLQRNDMELRDGWIVQRSGPDNALGLVKFDMHNEHAIYLHDTSAPELFGRSHRHRSHGCVRVEDALGFAQMLMDDQGLASEWEKAQTGGEQQFVPLKTRITVRLIYQNVFVDRDGKVTFRTDPYGWNAPIAKALGFSGTRETGMRSQNEADIAP